jgi:hypothetical protein
MTFLFFFSNLKNGINLYGAKVTKVLQWTPFLRRKTMKVSACFLLCSTGLNWFNFQFVLNRGLTEIMLHTPCTLFHNQISKRKHMSFLFTFSKRAILSAWKLPVCISCWETKVIARYGLARKDPWRRNHLACCCWIDDPSL